MFPWDIVILDPPKTYTQDGVCFRDDSVTEPHGYRSKKKTVKTKVEVEDHKSE